MILSKLISNGKYIFNANDWPGCVTPRLPKINGCYNDIRKPIKLFDTPNNKVILNILLRINFYIMKFIRVLIAFEERQ